MSYSDFISAFALVAIAFTVTDVRYRFRIRIAPISLYIWIFIVLALMGAFSLINGSIKNTPYVFLNWLGDKANPLNQFLGWLFWGSTLAWIWYGYISPPKFNKFNYKKYHDFLYRAIIQGDNHVLSVIALELSESARNIVKYSSNIISSPSRGPASMPFYKYARFRFIDKFIKHKPKIDAYAHDIILLIGNRKFCKHIATTTPGTAIAFFYWMSKTKKYSIPIGQFAKNITVEMLKNRDSTLYHEDHGFSSGLLGYIKPFSSTVYGNYILLENLSTDHGSPLDIDYKFINECDADQLEVYCRIVRIALKNYIRSFTELGDRCFALRRAIGNIKNACRGMYVINELDSSCYNSEITKKLSVAVSFIGDAMETLNASGAPLYNKFKNATGAYENIYDHIASIMFDIIYEASCVNKNRDVCWNIHYVSVWSHFFNAIYRGPVWLIIRFKLRRLIFNEVKNMEESPNYKSAKILALCLNVMGFEVHQNLDENSGVLPLKKVVLNWTKKNYLKIRAFNPSIADTCIVGSVSFEEENNRLVKSYLKGLDTRIPREYLSLD